MNALSIQRRFHLRGCERAVVGHVGHAVAGEQQALIGIDDISAPYRTIAAVNALTQKCGVIVDT
jgi:hypothetical protein